MMTEAYNRQGRISPALIIINTIIVTFGFLQSQVEALAFPNPGGGSYLDNLQPGQPSQPNDHDHHRHHDPISHGSWSPTRGSHHIGAGSYAVTPSRQDTTYNPQQQSGVVGKHYKIVDTSNPKVSSGKSFIYEAVPRHAVHGGDEKNDPQQPPDAIPDASKRVIVKLSSNLEALEREHQNYQTITEQAREQDLFVKVHGYTPQANPNDEVMEGHGALIMERGNKDLQTYIRKYGALQGFQLQSTAWTLARCVQAVHNSNMVWTELKAANFVVNNANPDEHQPNGPYKELQVKAIDLESATVQNNNPIDFSPEASPPEFLSEFLCGREPLVKVDPSFDIWSLGILFYKLATGKAYFNTDVKDGLAIALAIKQAEAEEGRVKLDKHVDIDEAVDPEFRGLIKWCLEMNPMNRPNIDQVLLHPYFDKQDPR